MGKGCGCLGFTAAVVIGLILGIIGLGAAGYFWVNDKVLSDQPVELQTGKWGRLDEAALSLKCVPVARAIKQNREAEYKLSLKANEANRLLGQYVLTKEKQIKTSIAFADPVTVIAFSRPLGPGRYLNGELRAEIVGKNGEFTVKVYKLRTGEFVWPRALLPQVSHWLEGVLETQSLFKNDPWRLIDYNLDKGLLKVTVRVVKKERDAGAN